jgi:molecular chaperone GrpE
MDDLDRKDGPGGWDGGDGEGGGDGPGAGIIWEDLPPPGGEGPEGAGAGEAGGEGGEGEGEGPGTDWEAEAAIMKDQYLRVSADLQNVRWRHQKELESARKYSSEPILRDLITVIENLHLALSYADPSVPAVKGLADGVGLTLKDCLSKMADHGFKEVTCAPGDAFDPNFQEAVGVEPAEGLPDSSIARMVSRGYLLHDRLLRPVKVTLVKNPRAE